MTGAKLSRFIFLLAKAIWEETFGRIVPNRRAKRLLLRHLSPEQREMFLKRKRFVVIDPSGLLYVIMWRNEWGKNVYRIDRDGKATYLHTIQAAKKVPRGDELLAQKLWIESTGNAFCRGVTNRRKLV